MKLLDRPFFRILLGTWIQEPQNNGFEYEFTPYFQYKIAPYEEGYLLYFTEKPNRSGYKDAIFKKMNEFSGHTIAAYLDHHYTAYDDKKDFLRFLRYELHERIMRHEMQERLMQAERQEKLMRNQYQERPRLTGTHFYLLTMQTAFEWVREQEALLPDPPPPSLPDSQLPDSNNPHPDSDPALAKAEIRMEEMARSYTGKIAFNNKNHQEKFIELLLLLQNLKAPGKKSELLFHRCTATDLASIIRQLEENNAKKPNTLQGYITKTDQHLDRNDPRIQKLEEALLGFFYR
jgi:hypothetical protein